MKKKLIEALTTKFAGVDAKVFGRIADNILDRKTIETDEDVEAAVAEISFKDVLESYGDARATESARTAKRNAISDYEKRYKLKDGKKVAQKDDDDDDDDPNADPNDDDKKNGSVLAQMKKLFAGLEQKLDAANNEIAAMKKGKITDGRKAQLNELLKGLTEAERRPYARISVDDMSDEDFNAFMEEVNLLLVTEMPQALTRARPPSRSARLRRVSRRRAFARICPLSPRPSFLEGSR